MSGLKIVDIRLQDGVSNGNGTERKTSSFLSHLFVDRRRLSSAFSLLFTFSGWHQQQQHSDIMYILPVYNADRDIKSAAMHKIAHENILPPRRFRAENSAQSSNQQ